MTTAHVHDTDAPAEAAKPGRDSRTFWRVLLAILAPLPLLSMGISYIINPIAGEPDFAKTVAGINAHHTAAITAEIFDLPFLLFLIPATFALIWCTRRTSPTLTAVGGVIALLGFLAGFPLLPQDSNIALVAADKGLDMQTVVALNDAMWAQPAAGVASLLFITGVVIGLPLLGIALWRSRIAPVWMCLCLIVGAVTHPFIPEHTAKGIGLIVGSIGFLAVSRILLRMSNDQFDLPAAVREPHRRS